MRDDHYRMRAFFGVIFMALILLTLFASGASAVALAASGYYVYGALSGLGFLLLMGALGAFMEG